MDPRKTQVGPLPTGAPSPLPHGSNDTARRHSVVSTGWIFMPSAEATIPDEAELRVAIFPRVINCRYAPPPDSVRPVETDRPGSWPLLRSGLLNRAVDRPVLVALQIQEIHLPESASVT